MIIIKRINSSNPYFAPLIELLDRELWERYGNAQGQYTSLNYLEEIITVVLALYNNEPAGCGCFKIIDNQKAEIKRMFVKKEYRGFGISARILSELEDWALESGFSEAVLETGSKQHEAIGLYKKSGYVKINNYGPYINMPESICFSKSLKIKN